MMIRRLSDDLRSHLRSGVAITSVTQCTEELVMNALDAGATCIAIRVDLPCFKVQVVDNGQGMTIDQLNQVGERYSTSKCHELEDLNNLQYFGYRGEAIASMRDTAAILEISSRTKQCHQTYCRMFQKGSGVPVTQSAVQRPSVGTTVTVHDLFYSLPVRRKAANEALELEKIRYRVEGIALINPSVSFTLRNDVTAHVLLQTRKSSSTLTSFTHLFGQGKAKSLREVTVEKEDFDVRGYIGKEGHSNKNLQFVFVNSRLVLKTKIHKVLNHLLKRSLVLKKRGSNTEYNPSKTPGESQTSSPGRQGEKYAVFVLNVKCPLDVYDITFDPAKTLVEFKHWSVLTNAIDEMVMSFLRKENLVSVSDFSSLSSVTPGTEFNSQNNQVDKKECVESSDPQDEEDNGCEEGFAVEKDYTGNISTHSTRNCLFSRTVRRPYDRGDLIDEDVQGENMLVVGEDNITRICESVTERRESPTKETPVTHVDDSCHVTADIYIHERSKPPTPNCGQSSAYKSDTSEDRSSVSESHVSTSDISPQTSTLDSALETGCSSVHSVTSEESQQCFTAVRAPTHSAAPPGESEDPFPADESEDPFPSSLRGALSTNDNGLLVSRQKYASTEQQSEKIPFICLPDSPPPSSTLGVHKLQNLRLISSKPSHYSTSKHKLDVTSMGPQTHKSAAQKISERLGLTGKKIISEKLQKFKSKSVSSRLNISKTSSTVSHDEAKIAPMNNDKLAVPNNTLNQQSELMVEKSVSNGDSILCESVLFEISHDETNKLSSKTDDEESNLSKQTSTVSVSSKSSGLDSDVQTSSGGDLEIGHGRKPIVPTIADIDTLIFKSETAPRKRFNPFALSTASKLSKLVRNCDSSDQDTSLTKQREFLSSDTLLEVPRSLSKAKDDDKMAEICEGLSVQSCDRHHECREKQHVNDHTDDMPTHNRELLTFQQSGQTNVHESKRHSVNNLQKHETHQTPDSTDLPINKKVLPFVVYSDIDCMKDVDRITDMDVSEADSIDSLPYIDCFSPIMADQEAVSVTPDISTHPKVQPSQGFSPDVRLLCEEDCQSGGFSPRIVDEVMSSTSSPSGPIYTDKEKEGKFPSDVTNNIEKNGDACSSARPSFGLTETPKYPKETSCENEDELAVCDSVTSTNTCSGRFDHEENEMDVASVRSHLHTTSEADKDSSYIACGQHPATCEDTSSMCSTEDTDSFPLRILLSGDSGEVDVAVNRPDIFRSENQKSSSNSESDVVDSSAGLTLDDKGNEINEALAKEFDSDMAEENFVYSREVTVQKPCTSRETINSTRSDCKHGDTGVSSSQTMDDEHREPQSSMASMTEETSSYGNVGTEGRHEGTAVSTWSEMKDPKTGVKIYVNKVTGNTMFEDQWRECEYSESENFQPGVSSKSEDTTSSEPLCSADREKLHQLLNCHLVAGTVDDQVKWRQPSCSAISQSQSSEQSTIEDLFFSWENPVCHIPPQSCVNAEVSPASRAAVQSYQTLYPTRFSKPMLQTVQVLGQVDNKFIACVLNTSEKNPSQAPDLIVLFDQHAAHERVRLEQLTEDIYMDGEDITECSMKQSHVSPPKTLTFTHEEVRLIKSFREEFKRIGVVFTVSGSSRDSLNIHSIPACLVEREANEVKRGRDSVVMDIAQVLIKEHLEMLRVTGGARNRLPQTIHKVLCSQACHGAVKFGDSLSLSQCQELLDSLAQCDLPFQCAHGRPSIMPLLGLEQLQSKLPPQRVKRPNLWKISKNLPIHQ